MELKAFFVREADAYEANKAITRIIRLRQNQEESELQQQLKRHRGREWYSSIGEYLEVFSHSKFLFTFTFFLLSLEAKAPNNNETEQTEVLQRECEGVLLESQLVQQRLRKRKQQQPLPDLCGKLSD